MQSWSLLELEMPGGSRNPIVLHSTEEARALLIGLNPGQELGDHQVHEHAYLVVLSGNARIESAGESIEAPAGTMVRFDGKERRRVSSEDGARLLMLLAPWPGPGHFRGDPASGGSAGGP